MTGMHKNKVALIEALQDLEMVNLQIGKYGGNRTLFKLQEANVGRVNKLINHLNSMGKLSAKEAHSLFSLDLMSPQRFKLKFKIGGT
jgi:hypothetical protein